MKHFDLIVTRHPGLVEFLNRKGITATEILAHIALPSYLEGKSVIGVLPCNLAAKCALFAELELDIPFELRNTELTCKQVEKYQRGLNLYRVQAIQKMVL